MKLFINIRTRNLILTMGILVLFVVLFSIIYYKGRNSSVDPRIVQARYLYENYNKLARNAEYDSVFLLMDEIENIYNQTAHYFESYETGVLCNNRAAAFLGMTFSYDSSLNSVDYSDSLVSCAEKQIRKAIRIYEDWMKIYSGKSMEEITSILQKNFYSESLTASMDERSAFLKNRSREILDAQTENPRRLSVAFTNLGLVYRLKQQYDSAVLMNNRALELWDRNLTAENNMNILLGRPLKKRNILQKIFPPDRKQEN